jgi:CubicO group peptidase (beta-lactamase class C family)
MNPARPGVTRRNWRTHPHSIWAFQNLATFLPTAEVAAARDVRPLVEQPVALNDLRFETPEAGQLSWADFLERTHTDAIIVLHHGRIRFEHYANGMRAGTPHMLFSITKSIVGLLAEMLIESGEIDERRRASHYVPDLSDSPFGKPTLRELLDMRDGVWFDEDYADPDAAIHHYSAAYWGTAQGGVRSTLPHIGDAAEPGAFSYRTPVTDVLGWCLACAAGKPLAEIVSERLWQPIGAERPAFFIRDTGGREIAAAGLNATLRDVARLAGMLADRGSVAGRQVVSRAIVERIAEGGDRAAFARAGFATRFGWSYRSQWWVPPERGRFCAMGVFGQRIVIDIPAALAIVRFGSHPFASNATTDAIHAAAFDALISFVARRRP